jgi:hypothetical protein
VCSIRLAATLVNEVVSLRCGKKRQILWANKRAYLLVQVRVDVLNGDLKSTGYAQAVTLALRAKAWRGPPMRQIYR